MKIRADRADLADAVSWVAQATPKKPNAPALAGIRISAEAEVVTLQCFDYESSHSAVVACDVPSAGECLVSAHLLREILSALKGGTVELALDGERLTIACGKSTYRLGVMRLEDYPSLPKFPTSVGAVHASDLARLLATVSHAVSRDSMTPQLMVVHLAADGAGSLTGEATDRFRFAQASAPYDGKAFDISVPAGVLSSALKGLSGTLEVGQSKGLLGLSDGKRTVTTRLIEGKFPPFAKWLAIEPTITVDVDADALAEACKRADMVVEDRFALSLAFTAEEVAITADSESGQGAEYVPCEATGDFEAIYLGRYLAEALHAIGGNARLNYSAPQKPLIITSTDEDNDARTLVMPRKNLRTS